jgi:hypothetical protein
MKVRFRIALLAVLIMLLGTSAYSADDGVGIVSLTHVGVGVSDLQRALHFYVDELGMKEAFRLIFTSQTAIPLSSCFRDRMHAPAQSR